MPHNAASQENKNLQLLSNNLTSNKCKHLQVLTDNPHYKLQAPAAIIRQLQAPAAIIKQLQAPVGSVQMIPSSLWYMDNKMHNSKLYNWCCN